MVLSGLVGPSLGRGGVIRVAVVKAGAFGIVRVVHEVYGLELSQALGVLLPLTVIASITIVYGSIMAAFQDELKMRLAFSTISQVSYIALGVSLFSFLGSVGGVVHLLHQGVMKVTLFLCAGAISETLGITRISKMGGVGRRMPWTMGAFAVAALGMIGLPPMAGFVSKWHLGLGALDAGQPWVIAVLVASTVLNAVYYLPVVYTAFFGKPSEEAEEEEAPAEASAEVEETTSRGRFETDWLMLFPILTVAAISLLVGVFAGLEISPLGWVELIVGRGTDYEPQTN